MTKPQAHQILVLKKPEGEHETCAREAAAKRRADIQAHTEAYLKAGGNIGVLPAYDEIDYSESVPQALYGRKYREQ